MGGAQARRKGEGGKRSAKTGRAGIGQAKRRTRGRSPAPKRKSVSSASGQKRLNMTSKKTSKRAKSSKIRGSAQPLAESTRFELSGAVVEPPPRLLRESKSITAALGQLEKGIKFLYQKDFKKARSEFKSIIESYPGEAEILARTRSYLQICEREETARRKAVAAANDTYALGVMEHNRGNYEAAIAHFREALDSRRDAEYIFYSLAASLALKGDAAEAIQTLRRAIELNEDNRIYAKNDSDFASLHSNKDFTDLVGMSQVATGAPPLP